MPGRLPAAWGPPLGTAVIKAKPEDFQVIEQMAEPAPAAPGQREHLWLWVEKRGANTAWVARQLATQFGVRARDVGFAGRKDRHALTRQWFSLRLPGLAERESAPLPPAAADYRVLRHVWANRKIRRGQHDGNRFRLTLRTWQPDSAQLQERLALIAARGVPNYFGAQRFGRSFRAEPTPVVWPADREARGFLISAMRSHLFNLQLATGVKAGTWGALEQGEWLAWRGSAAGFLADEIDTRLHRLLAEGELSPTGWLPGLVRDSRLGPTDTEREILATWQVWIDQLCERRVECGRRASVLRPRGLASEPLPDHSGWVLTFELPPGGFATTVLAELCTLQTGADQDEEVQE